MKLQPFNLKAALAGAGVVTKSGLRVTDLRLNNTGIFASKWPVAGTVHHLSTGITRQLTWTREGVWLSSPDNPENLFMSAVETPKKKAIYWTNFYPGGESVGYSTRKEADYFAQKTRIGGKARKVVLEVAE